MTLLSLFHKNLHRGAPIVALAAWVCLSGCDREKEEGLPGEKQVLAQVGEQPITEFDLKLALDRSLGQFATESVERGARPEVLESLIESKAMAQLAEKGLTPNERQVLEKQVAAHREGLLVKLYLAKEAPPAPVTEGELRKYYSDHPARFGATTERRYELIFGTQALKGSARVEVLKKLTSLSKTDNWKEAITAEPETAQLGYATGVETEQALHPKLKELLKGLEIGRVSNVALVQGRAYVGRISGASEVAAKPLAEVSDDIRKTLQLVHTRDAVRKVGKKATQQVEVKRFKVDPAQKGSTDAS